ncbi:MAG: ArgE/DapE family deacylase [Acidobacteriota bacterium]|nr:ArgE/DapE family deacylase [Acidobacteriota bacterium]
MNVYPKISAEIERLRTPMSEFLQRLVQLPSLPGQEQPAQHFLAAKLRALDCKVEILKSDFSALEHHPAFSDDGVSFDERLNVVGVWTGSKPSQIAAKTPAKRRSLILNGHMDVVPVGDPKLWKFPPWSGTVENGKLHGRGSCDMKAGLTSAIFAVEALRNLHFEPLAPVLVESVIGEESGGVGTLTTLINGVRADAAIIMEPTRLRSCPVHAGALSFRIKITGRAIHASMKRFGVSAVEKFQQIFAAIQTLDRDRHLRYENQIFEFNDNIAPISIGTVAAGDWLSTVPETLVAEGRFGVFPGEKISDARTALSVCLDRITATDAWLKHHPPTLEWIEGQFEPGQTSFSEPIVEALSNSHAEVMGSRPQIQGVPYGSDLRLFTEHGKLPAVLYGPGDVVFAHTVEEHVELEEVFVCAKVLALLVAEWCGGHFDAL